MSNFTTRSHERLGDPARRTALAKMTDRQSDARVRVTTDDIPDFDALRDRGAAIRDEAIQNLPRYLDQLVVSFERNGVVVHRAASAAEAIDIVSGIAARYGGPVVKGKSMLSEEIGLNERLEADGLEVFETDLGEFIIQLAGEPPEHILAPAIHWSRERVRKLFEPLAGRPLGDDPSELVAFARGHLRAAVRIGQGRHHRRQLRRGRDRHGGGRLERGKRAPQRRHAAGAHRADGNRAGRTQARRPGRTTAAADPVGHRAETQ